MSIMNFTQAQLTSLISAINARAKLASPAFTGTPSLPTGTTAVTQTAGDNSTKISTTEFVKAQGYLTSALQDTAHSFTQSGYQKLSNGLIIQWVNINTTLTNPKTISFPITFPNAVLSVTPNGGEATSSWQVWYESSNTSGFTVGVSRPSGSSSTLNYVCIAIGH